MMKAVFFVVAFAALIHSSTQLKCYQCKSDNLNSYFPQLRSLPLCNKDNLEDSETSSTLDLSYACLTLEEKIPVQGNKDEILISRFLGPDVELSKCKSDLCNSGINLMSSSVIVLVPAMIYMFFSA